MSNGPQIHFPTPEEEEVLGKERNEADAKALPAMERLAEVLQGRSGQPYKLRSILWSLYNGKPASLVEVVCLDWAIRKDLVAVILAFGSYSFFYQELKAAVTKAGQWNWFEEEWQNVKQLEEYVKAAKEAA